MIKYEALWETSHEIKLSFPILDRDSKTFKGPHIPILIFFGQKLCFCTQFCVQKILQEE